MSTFIWIISNEELGGGLLVWNPVSSKEDNEIATNVVPAPVHREPPWCGSIVVERNHPKAFLGEYLDPNKSSERTFS